MFFKTLKRFLFFPLTLVRALFGLGILLIGAGALSFVWWIFLFLVLSAVGLNKIDTETFAIMFTTPFFIGTYLFFIITKRDEIFVWVEGIENW